MSDFPKILLALVGISLSAVLIGGSFAFGVATVCRWMKWAPVNTIINLNNYSKDADVDVSTTGEPNG